VKRTEITEPPAMVGMVAKVGVDSFTGADGWSFGLHGLTNVKVGDRVEMWGKGIGYTVRGLAIADTLAFYRTEDEQRAHDEMERRKTDARRVERYVDNRSEQDAKYDALPEVFRRRIDRFRAGNPEFRWEFEPYELMVCGDAVKIVGHCDGDVDRIKSFYRAPWGEHLAAGLDAGHSGNSMGCAFHLAALYATDPEMVVGAHGALVPLVGCRDYGCTHGEES